jgi:hypothetical protein
MFQRRNPRIYTVIMYQCLELFREWAALGAQRLQFRAASFSLSLISSFIQDEFSIQNVFLYVIQHSSFVQCDSLL